MVDLSAPELRNLFVYSGATVAGSNRSGSTLRFFGFAALH